MKGYCINLDCPNFSEDKKKIIDIPDGEEFVCPKCGKRLVQYQPGESWIKKHLIWIIAATVVVASIIITLCLNISEKNDEILISTQSQPNEEILDQPDELLDSELEVKEVLVPEEKTQPDINKTQTPDNESDIEQDHSNIEASPDTILGEMKSLPVVVTNVIKYSFGEYNGDIIDGIPNGHGIMYYTRHTHIAKHDTNNPPHYAEEGDYFDGTWGNGDIINGALYNKNKELKERIFAPKPFNPVDLSKE